MNPLPLSLRRQIVEAYERKEGTYFELARRFGVGEATVYRLVRLKRERGAVIAAAYGGISDEELPRLTRLVSEFPEATLNQLCAIWGTRTRREPSRSSMGRALRRAGITREKTSRWRARS